MAQIHYPENQQTPYSCDYLKMSIASAFTAFLYPLLFGMYVICWSASLQAIEISAKGSAPIIQGNLSQAKEKAIEDAVRNASMQLGASVKSTQVYEQGLLSQDDIELNTQANIKNFRVVDESIKDHQFHVEISVDLTAARGCADDLSAQYQKTFAVAAFEIEYPKDLAIGQLRNVGQILGSRMTGVLNAQEQASAINASEAALYPSVHQAPRTWHPNAPLTQNAEITKTLGTQFLISAVIHSMGMLSPHSWLGLNQSRSFDISLYVHDGVTGSLLFNQRFNTTGSWHFDRRRRIRMGSAEFWDSDYGMQIDKTFADAAHSIITAVRCQPYMAHVIDAKQDRIRIAAGTASGLKPGDKLSLVRKTTQYGLHLEPLTELKRTYVLATIVQVQPNYSIAVLGDYADSARYAVQRGDLVVKW